MTRPAGVELGILTPGALCDAGSCTWTLDTPRLAFLGSGMLTLQVGLEDAPRGTVYPLAFHISSTDTDGIPANNDLAVELIVGAPTYLPLIMR
jgi:hypothetical protein